MFDEISRYYPNRPGGPEIYEVTDRRGRTVKAVAVPKAPQFQRLGRHLRRDGERLDGLAFQYLQDGTSYWRLAEINDAMSADQLAEAAVITIPTPYR